MLLEAHVVNLRDAAAQGSRGLLQPLLKRYQAGGCSMAVFALPAVQAVIHFKWWAKGGMHEARPVVSSPTHPFPPHATCTTRDQYDKETTPARPLNKRNSWARRFLLYELGAYCTWLLSFTAFTLLFQQEDWRLGFWEMMRNP